MCFIQPFLNAFIFNFLLDQRELLSPLTLLEREGCQGKPLLHSPKPCRWFQYPLVKEINLLIHGYNQNIKYFHTEVEALKQDKSEAQLSSQKKSEYLANMSHEIRTPMNSIIGLSSLLKDTPSNHQQAEYIDMLETSSLSLLDIVNDILDFSKIEAGRIDLFTNTFDLVEMGQEIEQLFKYRAKEKNLQLSFRHDQKLIPHLVGDPAKIRQVLNNLIGNAIKFTKEGQIKLSFHQVQQKRSSSRCVIRSRRFGHWY